jgi:hypothetical protein
MYSQFALEIPAFEIDPESGGEADEWRRRSAATGRRPGGGIRPSSRPGRSRPLSRTRQLGPRAIIQRRPPAILQEPFPIEPTTPAVASGSERVRWVQDCLNQALRMQLPVTGIMGPETRSAVRTFQQQQRFRVTGIAGPDTEEALKGVCAGGAAAVDPGEGQEDSELEPLTATVTWLPSNENPRLFTREEASSQGGAGVYIVVESADGRTINRILKVGKTHRFASRFGKKDPFYGKPLALRQGRRISEAVPADRLRFYLGRLDGFVDPTVNVERALARLLARTGEALAGGIQVPPSRVLGRVNIRNILPKPLRARLPKAYRASGTGIPKGTPPEPNIGNTLVLEPATFPKWEVPETAASAGRPGSRQRITMHPRDCRCPQCRMANDAAFGESEFLAFGKTDGESAFESPFREAEELALVAELLSITNEAELDQFLGKLVRGAWRGIKKVGRFVGKIAKPLGGVLKGVAKAALPFVGGALGSFIPIPGVGTALGSALGGALSRALEMEFGELSRQEQEFEMARRFVRLAGTAARRAALAPTDGDEQEILETALMDAARRHLPSPLRIPGLPSRLAGHAASGRWVRRGNDIVVLGI